MGTVEISLTGLFFGFLLLMIPIAISYWLNLKIIRQIFISVGRMSIQLFLVGFFLEYIFKVNSFWLNLGWLTLMILTAVFSALSKIKIKFSIAFLPVLLSFIFSTFLVLLYFNAFVIRLDFLFEARYLIALGGMLLGNILSLNIVILNSFYRELRIQEKFFFYRLAMGATQKEVLSPFIRHCFQLTLLPMLARVATMGIVTLPGMMSGQIIGGSSPATAIRYQIAVMVMIFVSGTLSSLLTLVFSINKSFNKFGVLKKNIFKN
jgi:putative ABC transport system permease protein